MSDETEQARQLGAALGERGFTLATAESCTGGLIGHLITEIAGSSAYFTGGIVAYSNAVKHALLGVPQDVLNTVGAVSDETARLMARGVRARLGSDLGVATTGIAGPGGGTAAKPVGLVYIAVAWGDEIRSERHVFAGDRQAVKAQTAAAAFRLLLEVLHYTER